MLISSRCGVLGGTGQVLIYLETQLGWKPQERRRRGGHSLDDVSDDTDGLGILKMIRGSIQSKVSERESSTRLFEIFAVVYEFTQTKSKVTERLRDGSTY